MQILTPSPCPLPEGEGRVNLPRFEFIHAYNPFCGQSRRPLQLHRPHIHLDTYGLPAAAEADSADGSNIAIIAAPRERDMTVGDDQVIGGIKSDPAASRKKDGDP